MIHEGSDITRFRTAFRELVEERTAALRDCSIAGLPHSSPVSGRFTLRVIVAPSGAVQELTLFEHDAQRFPMLSACVASVVRSLLLAPTGLQRPLGIDYAFVFRTVLLFQRRGLDSDFVLSAALADRFEISLDASLVGTANRSVPSN